MNGSMFKLLAGLEYCTCKQCVIHQNSFLVDIINSSLKFHSISWKLIIFNYKGGTCASYIQNTSCSILNLKIKMLFPFLFLRVIFSKSTEADQIPWFFKYFWKMLLFSFKTDWYTTKSLRDKLWVSIAHFETGRSPTSWNTHLFIGVHWDCTVLFK